MDDPDEEEMGDINLDDGRERPLRMVFEDNDGGVDDAKALIHAKRWDIYVKEREKLVKGGYLVEVFGHDKKKVLWEVVNDNVVEEPTDHEEIGLRGFDFNVFDQDEEGFGIEGSSEFPYLIMLIKLWPVDWKTQLKMMNHKVDEDNEKVLNKGNVRYRKVCHLSSNEFWKNIGFIVSAPNFCVGGLRLWEKGEDIKLRGKKRKIRLG